MNTGNRGMPGLYITKNNIKRMQRGSNNKNDAGNISYLNLLTEKKDGINDSSGKIGGKADLKKQIAHQDFISFSVSSRRSKCIPGPRTVSRCCDSRSHCSPRIQ